MLYKSQFNKALNAQRSALSASGGFTIAELLVAISIVMVLSVISVVNLRTGSSEQALLRSAQTLAFNIRKAQNLALAPQLEGGQAICFYGIKIDNNDTARTSYFLYYNDKSSCVETNVCIGSIKYTSGQSVEKDRFYLEKGVEFHPSQINSKDAAFIPPEPLMCFNGAGTNDGTITIRLKNDISKTKSITINKVGKVEIQ